MFRRRSLVNTTSCIRLLQKPKWYTTKNNVKCFGVKSFADYSRFYNYTMDGFVSTYIENDIISHDKLSNPRTSRNLLLIGAGPNPSISNLIGYFDKIYLVEPNNYFH
eukprot:44102_1